jgi:hypothetical protein
MNDQKEQYDKSAQEYWAIVFAFIDMNRKLADRLDSVRVHSADDIAALESLGRNAVVIRGLLWD